MKPWSYSSLTAFETCARRYYLTKVSKEVVEPPTAATTWGTTVHTALENRINGTPLAEEFLQYEQYITPLEAVGAPVAEREMALTKGFEPTGFHDDNAWCRGIIDVHVVAADKGVALDWKTGKVKNDSSQLKLFAAMMLHTYPELQQVKTGFVWLAHDKVTTDVFTRQHLGEIWQDFLPRVKRLEVAFEEDKWPAKPSGLCRAWCPVGKGLCQHCGS